MRSLLHFKRLRKCKALSVNYENRKDIIRADFISLLPSVNVTPTLSQMFAVAKVGTREYCLPDVAIGRLPLNAPVVDLTSK